MKHYILCIIRDMQSEFTFMQRANKDTTKTIVNQLEELGWYDQQFGKSSVVACEILNYKENMDLNDMILQHPYVPEWQMKYIGNYQYNVFNK